MANDANSQAALANDAAFRRRFKSALSAIVSQVLTEGAGVTNHAARKTYALQVVGNLDGYVSNLIGFFVMRTNVFAATTAVDLSTGAPIVQSAVTDAALQSQINTDFDFLAGAGA